MVFSQRDFYNIFHIKQGLSSCLKMCFGDFVVVLFDGYQTKGFNSLGV
jgi:hypothetical protein